MKIYNSLSRKKEDLETIEPGVVKMYVCGPTVYDKAHVGHAMSAIVFDIIRRYLEYKNYTVKHLMNFTDVDDKIIQRANKMNVDPFSLAEGYINEFEKHLSELNVLPATFNPRATQEIDTIISMVQRLIDKGFAYPADGDVYFRVTRDPDYGHLSGRKLDDMQAGARIEVDTRKEHPMDFALWKSAREDEPSWDSPWGKGRPGWHIECSAMNLHHLGEQIDIHGGGNDLVFPHHENEIAQTESLTGKPFARYWVHNGMLQLSGEKMSKSLGNLITIEEFLVDHQADVFRLMVLNSYYRGPLTFTSDVIAQAEKGLERLLSALRLSSPGSQGASDASLKDMEATLVSTKEKFIAAMDDDFNTSAALSTLFDLVRSINSLRAEGATDGQLKPAQDLFSELTGVLGLRLEANSSSSNAADPFIDLLVELRKDLRTEKLYALTDKIRDRLTALNVIIEDSKDGTTWRWK